GEEGNWELGVRGGNEGESAIVLNTYLQYRYLVCKLQNKRTPFPTQHSALSTLSPHLPISPSPHPLPHSALSTQHFTLYLAVRAVLG
ncbi:MAG: hypothetical protein LRZ84_23305, partial [Desertifilum sp.]|nr:hypothetical protein [Desertifilum sp.]